MLWASITSSKVTDPFFCSLDRAANEAVRKILKTRFNEHTVVAVLHSLESVDDFDKVLVMDKGRVVEFDTPGALMSVQSVFRELFNSQYREGHHGYRSGTHQ
jgi:ATP-binding cassette subfamily C (CFTR/MRP) protein 1